MLVSLVLLLILMLLHQVLISFSLEVSIWGRNCLWVESGVSGVWLHAWRQGRRMVTAVWAQQTVLLIVLDATHLLIPGHSEGLVI